MVNTSKSVSRSIVSNWANLGIAIVISFFISPIVVNKLGSVYYGIWALALQFTGYLYLADSGVRDAVVRYTAKYSARKQPRQLNTLLNVATLIYLPIALLCVVITLILVLLAPQLFELDPSYHADLKLTVLFAGLTIAQGFLFSTFSGIVYGLRRFDVANAIGISLTLVRAALIVVFLSAGHGVVALAVINFCVGVCAGFIYVFVSLRLLKRRGLEFKPRLLPRKRLLATGKRVAGYGTYALLHSIGQKVTFTSDAIVAGIVLSVQAVTPLAIAGGLIQYFRSLVNMAAKVFMPAASELQASGRSAELGELFLLASKLTVLIALPVTMVFVFLGDEFIELWMGPAYSEQAGLVLAVLGFTQIIAAPNYVITSFLYAISKHRVLAWLRLGEALANVTLSVVLGLKFGLLGIALGTAIPHTVLALLVLPRYACPLIGVGVAEYLNRSYGRSLLGAVPALAAVALLNDRFIFGGLAEFVVVIAVVTVLYGVSVYLLALTPKERAKVPGIIRFRGAFEAIRLMSNRLMQLLGAIYTRIPRLMRPRLKSAFMWTVIRLEALMTGRRVIRGQRIEFLATEIAHLEPFEFLSPGQNEVQVKALVSAVSPGTEIAVLCGLPGSRRSFPYVPGYSCAARVTRVGKGVKQFRVGQIVAGRIPHASDISVKTELLFPLPEGVSIDEASFIELGIITLQGLRKAAILPGDRVAVVGQGLIGQVVNKLAKMLGASPVIAIAPSASRSGTALVDGGADTFLVMGDSHFDPETIQSDVVIEAVGTPDAVVTAARCARAGGRVVLLGSARGLTRDMDLDQIVRAKELTIIGAHISAMPESDPSPGRHTYREEGRLFLELLRDRRLKVGNLVTWRASPSECNAVYESLAHGGHGHVAILFNWSTGQATQQ